MESTEVEDSRYRTPVMMDVARLAGVSHQTVSRVLNDSAKVSARTRERVERAVDQLGYRRNTSARALVTRHTMNLGVVAAGIWQYGPSVTLRGIAEAARHAGYATNVVSLGAITPESMRAALDHLLENSVDGIVIIAPVTEAVTAACGLSTEVPLVMFEPGVDNGTTTVAVDEVLGARLATRHLLELGHESVWHVSGPEGWLGTDARIRGWRAELATNGRWAHRLIAGDWSSVSGYRVGRELACNPDVTGVFVANDQMSLGVLRAFHENGVSVPGDISVIGFDDIPESGFFLPPLTTIRLDFNEVGRRCVERLLELIRGIPLEPTLPVQPELVARSSCGPPST